MCVSNKTCEKEEIFLIYGVRKCDFFRFMAFGIKFSLYLQCHKYVIMVDKRIIEQVLKAKRLQ